VKKVQAAATKLRYKPDPVLSHAMARIRRRSMDGNGEVLAYLVAYREKDEWRRRHIVRRYWEGALGRATELGFRIEPYWIGDTSLSQARHSMILYSRGIRGLILPPHPEAEGRIRLEWKRFSAVALSRSIVEPATHRVLDDHYAITRVAMERLLSLGYRRIGFAMSWPRLHRIGRIWLAAYLAYQLELRPENRIAPCLQDVPPPAEFDGPDLVKWIRKFRPDALIGPTPSAIQYLAEQGLKTPRDFAYASLDLNPDDRRFAGVVHDAREVGRGGVSDLVALLRNRELGLPEKPGLKLIGGEWRDGPSAPASAAV
jgi:LacI family transcriptional regulator